MQFEGRIMEEQEAGAEAAASGLWGYFELRVRRSTAEVVGKPSLDQEVRLNLRVQRR